MRKEDLRLRSWYGCGNYSGSECLVVLAYDVNDKEFLENNCEEFSEKTMGLGELDGKHSQVESNEYEDNDDILDVIYIYGDADTYKLEDIKWSYKEDTEVFKKLKKADDFIKKFKIVKKYKHKKTGEILNLGEYELLEEVVEK